MNRQIARLFAIVIVLFTVLVISTSWWSVFGAEDLENNAANRRPLLRQEQIPRGLILAEDGTELAESRNVATPQEPRYIRDYPEGPLFSHSVGYAYVSRGSAGLERFYNGELGGQEEEFKSIIEGFTTSAEEGNDLQTTLDPDAQRAAIEALDGQAGSVVAIEPDTGAVKTMVSLPDFDPNRIPDEFERLNRDPASPLLNRATQGRYPPGSTFKVVTAAAALDSGDFTPETTVNGETGIEIGGTPLANFGGQSFGPVSLTDALTNSVNTVWAQVGEQVGAETMFEYMERFGFGRKPPLDYPPDEIQASGVFDGQKILTGEEPVDIGRVAIGQERLQVSPLQMAMVASAVANDGSLMRPHFGDQIVAPDGRVQSRVRPQEMAKVMDSDTAAQVNDMMSRVVEEGSGTAAALQGIDVAGKTGTAEVEAGAANQAWFIAFAPADDPQMAIAATVERTQGTGGEVAAPVAKRVLEVLLEDG